MKKRKLINAYDLSVDALHRRCCIVQFSVQLDSEFQIVVYLVHFFLQADLLGFPLSYF